MYYVYLRVTDDDGAIGTANALVDLRVPFVVETSRVNQGNKTKVTLTWTGAAGDVVDIYRDGAHVATTSNTGSYVDYLPRIKSIVTYRACESATARCSNDAVVSP